MKDNGNHVVYLVDDDDAVRDSLRMLLESYGMKVWDFDSAREFLHAHPRPNSGCLLLDIHMPDMSGMDLLRELRARGAEIPVIVITGRYDAFLGRRAEDSNVLSILQKPIDDGELRSAIDRALNTTHVH